jgi:hypothetical protein
VALLTVTVDSHVAPEVSREAADRIAETLWQDDEDQADEPEAGARGRRMKAVAARVAARL